MRFTTIHTLVSCLVTLSHAATPEESAASAAVAVESYLESLPDEPGFQSALSDIARNPAGLMSLSQYLPSITSALGEGSVPASFFSNLPTGQAFSLISSVASEANALLTAPLPTGTGDDLEILKGAPKPKPRPTMPQTDTTADSVTGMATGTASTSASTSTSKAGAMETGKAIGIAAAAGAGFLGFVMAL